MNKRRIVKDDGRYLIFYSFDTVAEHGNEETECVRNIDHPSAGQRPPTNAIPEPESENGV